MKQSMVMAGRSNLLNNFLSVCCVVTFLILRIKSNETTTTTKGECVFLRLYRNKDAESRVSSYCGRSLDDGCVCEQEPIRIDQLIADDSTLFAVESGGMVDVAPAWSWPSMQQRPGAPCTLVRPFSVPVPHEMMNDHFTYSLLFSSTLIDQLLLQRAAAARVAMKKHTHRTGTARQLLLFI